MVFAKASAPGKAILFGEHAVVYGVSAIAGALSDLRIFVEIETVSNSDQILFRFDDILTDDSQAFSTSVSIARVKELVPIVEGSDPRLSVKPTPEVTAALQDEFSNFPSAGGQCMMAASYLLSHIVLSTLQSFGKDLSVGLSLNVRSIGLPLGAGLGSSAAYSVALSGASWQLYHKLRIELELSSDLNIESQDTLKIINDWAFVGEILIHGTPSGLDNTTSCYGGMLKFNKKESGNIFEQIPYVPSLNTLLINTKVPRSTKVLVAGVRGLYDSFHDIISPIFTSINNITEQFLNIANQLKEEKIQVTEATSKIGNLIRINHDLLNAIGVGHSSLTTVVEISRQLGYPCKLTGAGGGGCAIALITDSDSEISNVDLLKQKLKDEQFDVFSSSIGGKGVLWY